MTTTSSAPSSGRVASIPEPAPNAPLMATMTCHARPANASRPSTRTVHSSGSAVAAARTAPTR
jgi:hypothetical protein